MSREVEELKLELNGGSSFYGEVSIVGKGKQAYLRIESRKIGDGIPTCAWSDNGPRLRRWMKSALKRLEAK